jgi:hypothetical protein
MLLQSGQPITLHAPQKYTTIRDLKKIFNIEHLTIVDKEIIDNDLWPLCTDKSKFFSPYFNINNLTLFNQQYHISKKRKPCIGLATWDITNEFAHNAFPYNRLYSREFWSKIFQLLQSAGYDVLTFNKLDVTLEQKTWMLNELCDGIIGYEGGMCHLAHLLSVPTIIMPWHHHENGSTADASIFYVPHKLHLDKKTYFVRDEQEILSWTSTDLATLMAKLHNGQGNNVFFNSKLDIDTNSFRVKTTDGQNLNPMLSTFEKNFIKTYISNPTVGGF